jgi:hypothetical protein
MFQVHSFLARTDQEEHISGLFRLWRQTERNILGKIEGYRERAVVRHPNRRIKLKFRSVTISSRPKAPLRLDNIVYRLESL